MRTAEDKALYRAHVFKLAQGRAIPISQTQFWSVFWTQPESNSEVLTAASVAEWRSIRDQNIVNVLSLVQVLLQRIVLFAGKVTANTPPPPTGVIVSILNCARLLTRVLPILYEHPEYQEIYEFPLFWSSKRYDPIDVIDKLQLESQLKSRKNGDIDVRMDYEHPKDVFAVQVVESLMALLFIRGFTVPQAAARNDHLWEKGISAPSSSTTSTAVDASTSPSSIIDCNRTEMLKLILTLFSSTMYQKLEDVTSENNNFLLLFITSTPKAQMLDLVASLTNLLCRSGTNSNNNGLQFSTQEQIEARHLCVTHAAQLLTLMLVFPVRDNADLIMNLHLYTGSKPFNLVRVYLSSLKTDLELAYIAENLVNIIIQPIAVSDSQNYNFQLGRTVQPAIWAPHSIVLLWELLQCNNRFRAIIAKKYTNKILIGLTYNIITFWNNSHHSNLVRVSLFFMLYLSAELRLVANMFRPLSRSLYESLPRNFHLPYYPQTTRDFLIVHLCRTLISAFPLGSQQPHSPNLNNHAKTMTDSVLTTIVEILYNIIPCISPIRFDPGEDTSKRLANYNKDGGLSYTTSCEIIQLLDKFANRSFLLSKPLHVDLLALLVRATCVVCIKYPEQSRMFLYALKKNEKSFVTIQNTMNSFSTEFFKGNLLRVINDNDEDVDSDDDQNLFRNSSTLTNLENSVEMPPLTTIDSHRSDQMSITSSQYLQDSEVNEALFIQSLGRLETNYTRSNSIYSTTILQQEDKELSDVESLVSEEEVDEALHPKLPVGMSKDAREKLPIDAPLKTTWPGNEPLRIITMFILPNLDSTANGPVPVDAYIWITTFDFQKFSQFMVQKKSQIPSEYLSSEPLDPLEFLWSHVSLGWYISLLWGNIYNTNHNVKTYVNQNQNIINSLSTGLASLGKWTGFVRQKVANEFVPLEWTRRSLTTVNHWFGTEIKLFKVNESLNDGIFGAISKLTNMAGAGSTQTGTAHVNGGESPTLFRKYNDTRPAIQRNGSLSSIGSFPQSGGVASPPPEDQDTRLGRHQRNSLTSLHSLNTLNRSRTNTPRNSMCI